MPNALIAEHNDVITLAVRPAVMTILSIEEEPECQVSMN
jgi:hypothetical protein